MTNDPAETTGTDDELARAQAEIARLAAENEELRTQPAAERRHWVRGTAVGLLLVLGFVLVPVSGVAVWTRNTLLNTDRYVETVAPLADSQPVIDDVAAAITNAIFEKVPVEQLLAENLPPKLSFAAGPIANQVKSTTNDLVIKALQSDQFDVLWKAVNRQASASVVAFVTGKNTSTVLQVQNGQLILNIGPIVDDVKQQLSAQGLSFVDKIPAFNESVDLPVANVQYLVDARKGAKLLNTLAWLLPFLALACFAGAIALSRRRRRTLITSALLVSGGALLVGFSLGLSRSAYLDAMVGTQVSQETAGIVFDTLVRFLRNGIRVLFFLGLIVAIGAAVTGQGAWAVKLRGSVGGLVTEGGQRSGLDTGGFGRFLSTHRTGYRVATVAFFGIVLFLVNQPTPSTLLWLVVGTVLVLAVLEFFAATAPRGDAVGEESQPEPATVAGE